MAGNIALGIKEVQHEHSGDESDDDVDDVVEQSPCGRWEKRRQEVIVKLSLFGQGEHIRLFQSSYGLFVSKLNGQM